VLEVVRYNPSTEESVVLSARGEKADWYRNIEENPALEVWTAGERYVPKQRFLASKENEAIISEYGDVVEYQDSQEPPSAEVLSGQIVERADQIHRTLLGEPSEIEVEMCALGCRACMDDLITLALLVSEEQMRSGPLRRMKPRAAYRCATDSLSRTRQSLGLYTVSVSSEERHRK